MRQVIQDLAVRQLGAKLNISSWRHIAIAIGRRYLRGIVGGGGNSRPGLSGAGTGTVAYGDSETDGDDLLGPDDPWDLQAGHSSRTAEMVYGRRSSRARQGSPRARSSSARSAWPGTRSSASAGARRRQRLAAAAASRTSCSRPGGILYGRGGWRSSYAPTWTASSASCSGTPGPPSRAARGGRSRPLLRASPPSSR